jgi:hypothetical protein
MNDLKLKMKIAQNHIQKVRTLLSAVCSLLLALCSLLTTVTPL